MYSETNTTSIRQSKIKTPRSVQVFTRKSSKLLYASNNFRDCGETTMRALNTLHFKYRNNSERNYCFIPPSKPLSSIEITMKIRHSKGNPLLCNVCKKNINIQRNNMKTMIWKISKLIILVTCGNR